MPAPRFSWRGPLALGAAALVLVLLSPPLRTALVAIEPAIGPALFWIGLLGGIASRALQSPRAAKPAGATQQSPRAADDSPARRRVWRLPSWMPVGRTLQSPRAADDSPARRRVWRLRRFEVALLRLGGAHGWWLAILVFLIPLWSQWAAQPPSAISAHAALLGVLPWGDARGHYEGGIRLLSEGEFLTYSARRPLHACWLAVRLALSGGSVPVALGLQAAVLGLAAWLLSRSVAARLGGWPAVAVFGFVYAFARDYSPAVLTEPLGMTFACLALAIFFTSAVRQHLVPLALAFLSLDAALRARPGAQFLLPALALWVVFVFRGRRLRALAVVVAVALFGSLFTAALNRFYSSGEATFTSHLAFTLYGLAHGASYEKAYEDAASELPRPEVEVSRPMLRRALTQIAAEPRKFLAALWHNETKFLSKAPVAVMRLVSPRSVFVPADERVKPVSAEIRRDKTWGGLPLLVAAIGTLVFFSRNPAPVPLFWLASAVGLAASAPFVYSDTGFRSLAAGYPFIALFFALGCAAHPPRRLLRTGADFERRLIGVCGGITIALLATALVGPALARGLWPRAAVAAAMAPSIAVVDTPRAPLVVVRNPLEVTTYGSLRVIDRPDFLRLLRFADLKGDLEPLTQRRPPFVVMSAYDHASRRVRTLVGPVELAQPGSRFVRIETAAIADSQELEEVVRWEPWGN